MNALELMGWATGLGFLAGLRLYATVLTLGLAIRFGWMELGPEFENLRVLGDWWVIGASAAVFALEFVADKVPWVDSVWDAIHTFIRPLGASVVAAAALGDINPVLQVTGALLAGGVALGSHSAKAATRLAVNQSPEPFSNWILSLLGDAAVPLGVWFTSQYPLLVGGFVAVFLVVFLAVAPWLYRFLRLEMAAFVALLRQWLGAGRDVVLPEKYADYLGDAHGAEASARVFRGVVGKGARRLRNSLGYLVLREDKAKFVTRRWFRFRTCGGGAPRFESGMLFDRCTVTNGNRTYRFDLLKTSSKRKQPSSAPDVHHAGIHTPAAGGAKSRPRAV